MEAAFMIVAQDTELGLHPKGFLLGFGLTYNEAFELFHKARIASSFYTFRNWIQGENNPTTKTRLETYDLYQKLVREGREPVNRYAIAQFTSKEEW
jgi:hypothetical protein